MTPRLLRLLKRLLRAGRVHEDAAALRQRRILKATRTDLIAALAVLPVGSYRAAQLGVVLQAVDQTLAPRQAESVRIGGQDAREAFALGRAQADAPLGELPAVPTAATFSAELLQAVVDVTEDQLRDVWGELGSSLKGSIRRVALGAETPDQAIDAVQRLVRSPKTFGTAETRAEMIVRTETNRTYSVAADARYRELNATFDGQLRKAWLASFDRRTRKSHRAAGETYGPSGSTGPIPLAQRFQVGGTSMRYPLDPLAPAREVVGCRCRLIAVPPTINAAEWAAVFEELQRVQEET